MLIRTAFVIATFCGGYLMTDAAINKDIPMFLFGLSGWMIAIFLYSSLRALNNKEQNA